MAGSPVDDRVERAKALLETIEDNEKLMGEGAAMYAAFEMHNLTFREGIELLRALRPEEKP